MSWLNIFGIAVALAMDAFAVSVATGITVKEVTGRHVFRIAWHFGLFQFLMPVAGWFAGRAVAAHIKTYDHWVAFFLLSLIGGKMLLDVIRNRPDGTSETKDPTRGLTLLTLAVATSIDALAVGISLAMLRVSIWVPSVVIGLVAGILSMIGIRFGDRIGSRCERWAGLMGGLMLVGIGVRILVTHLME